MLFRSLDADSLAYPGSYLLKLGKGIGVEGETWTMAFDLMLMTSVKTPDDVVYKSVKALYSGKPGLMAVSKVFGHFNPKAMAVDLKGIGIHPGAMKFYKEVGVEVGGS